MSGTTGGRRWVLLRRIPRCSFARPGGAVGVALPCALAPAPRFSAGGPTVKAFWAGKRGCCYNLPRQLGLQVKMPSQGWSKVGVDNLDSSSAQPETGPQQGRQTSELAVIKTVTVTVLVTDAASGLTQLAAGGSQTASGPKRQGARWLMTATAAKSSGSCWAA